MICGKNKLDRITETVKKAYINVYGKDLVQIVLYGSYARGDFNEFSDIDFAAIVKGDRSLLQSELKKVWEETDDISLEYEIIISPVVIPLDEYQKYKQDLPYYRNIAQEGVKIFG
jgi:predicted nucleotidyltransferase